MSDKENSVTFSGVAPDIEALRKMIFKAFDATIETMIKGGLTHANVEFDYTHDSKINCEIQLPQNLNVLKMRN